MTERDDDLSVPEGPRDFEAYMRRSEPRLGTFVDGVYEHLALRDLERGRRPSPAARIISHVGLLLIVFVLAHLIERREWLAMGLLLLATLPRLGLFALLASLVYRIVVADWIGAGALATSAVLAVASGALSFRYAKADLRMRRTGISAFEGWGPALGLAVQIAALTGAVLLPQIPSVIAWCVFAVALLLQASRYYFRLATPWRRVHYPLMFRWSQFAALLAVQGVDEASDPDVELALHEFVRSVFPSYNSTETKEFVDAAEEARRSFSDEGALRDLYSQADPTVNGSAMEELLGAIRRVFASSESIATRLAFIIAVIVEHDYGKDERARYLYAVLKGDAK